MRFILVNLNKLYRNFYLNFLRSTLVIKFIVIVDNVVVNVGNSWSMSLFVSVISDFAPKTGVKNIIKLIQAFGDYHGHTQTKSLFRYL